MELNDFLMVWFLSKKRLGVHVQHMLEMSRRLYTGENLSKMLGKIEGKSGILFYDHDLTN